VTVIKDIFDIEFMILRLWIKLAHCFIVFFLLIGNSWGQYMPLDLSEANQRVINPQRENDFQDSSLIKNGIDISIISNKGISLFIVPSFRTKISKNISYNYKVFLTNDPSYGPRIGSRYERSGNYTGPSKPGDLSTLQSYIYIDLNNIKARLGKFSPWNNHNQISGLDNVNNLSPIHGIEYQYKERRLKYTHGYYWLGYSSENDDVEGYSRFYATQKIEYNSRKFAFEVGDRVLYAGINQAFDWSYAVPFDPFILSIFNFGAPRNNDNHVIDMSFVYHIGNDLRIIGELILDEFQIDIADRLLDDDEYGYQLSAILNTDTPHLKRVAISHTRTTDYFGIHYGKSINYEIHGIPILSEYGPQVDRTEIRQNYHFKKDFIKGWVSIFRESRGENGALGTPWQLNSEISSQVNRTHLIGIETEILINLYKNYYSFIYVSFNDTNRPTCKLSLVYSLKL
jgi:hypothetical protein